LDVFAASPAAGQAAAAMMAARAHRSEVGRNASYPQRQLYAAHEERGAGSPRVPTNETEQIMNVLRFVRSRFNAAYALGVILLGAAALAAVQYLVPDEELTTLRSFIPGATPILGPLLFGWVGVAIGRLSIGATSSAGQRDSQKTPRRETDVKDEKIDRILHHIIRVLQTHVADSEIYSKRLDRANERLSQQQTVGPINEIVLALVEDNREMRAQLQTVSNKLEESGLFRGIRRNPNKKISIAPGAIPGAPPRSGDGARMAYFLSFVKRLLGF
jgi:hypothetical protein